MDENQIRIHKDDEYINFSMIFLMKIFKTNMLEIFYQNNGPHKIKST